MSDQPSILFVGAAVKDFILDTGRPLSTLSEASKRYFRRLSMEFGGGGFNAAVAAAAINDIRKFGFQIVLASKIGHGPQASQPARHGLAMYGVQLSDAINSDRYFEIPHNFALSATDDRHFEVDPKEYPPIDPGYEDELRELIRAAKVVHIHTRLDDLAKLAADIAFEEGKPFVVDASGYGDTLERILSSATYAVLPDELSLPGVAKDDPQRAQRILEYIIDKGVIHAAVMCGAEDTLYCPQNGALARIPVYAGPDFEIRGKVGAGDAARAALALSMARDEPFETCLQIANLFGTYSCAYPDREWISAYRDNPHDLIRVTGYRPDLPVLGAVFHPPGSALA